MLIDLLRFSWPEAGAHMKAIAQSLTAQADTVGQLDVIVT